MGCVPTADCRLFIPETAARYNSDMSILKVARMGHPVLRAKARRIEKAEDVANVIGFLATERAAYMTGQALNVTGGLVMH